MADAFGRMLLAYHRNEYDGSGRYRSHTGTLRDGHPEWYFGESFDAETEQALEVVQDVGDTVVDAGCGAGSHTLRLQRAGLDVLATDVSPGALRVARKRGVERIARGDLRSLPTISECVFLAGTQLGLGGSTAAFQETLAALASATTESAHVVGDLKDPFAVEAQSVAGSDELRTFDREEGTATRRFRTEFRDLTGPWLELLCLTPAAARRAIAPTTWQLDDIIEGDGARYFLVLRR